jgi:hypothetical protein
MDLAEQSAKGVFLPRARRWILSADLGQSNDSTAICALEHVTGVVDFRSAYERHCNIEVSGLSQTPAERYNVRFMQRLSLGTSYPDVGLYLKELLSRPPLTGDGDGVRPAKLVIDETAIGRVACDYFEASGLNPVRVCITASNETTCEGYRHGHPNRFHVGKKLLITNVETLLHYDELHFSLKLADAPALREELQDFQRSLSAAGRMTFQARNGKHDDMVLAVALACWLGKRKEPNYNLCGVQVNHDDD